MVKYSYGGPLILALAMQMMLSINVCASEPSKPGGSCESKQFGEGGPSVKVCKDSMRCAVVGKKEQCLTVYAHKPEESPFADILDLSRTNFPCAVARGKRDEHPVKPGFWGAPNFSTYTDCGSGKWCANGSKKPTSTNIEDLKKEICADVAQEAKQAYKEVRGEA